MQMLIPVLVALLAALPRGGSARALVLELERLRGLAFFLIAMGVQIVLFIPGPRQVVETAHLGEMTYVATMLLVLIGALANWRLGWALRVATLGLALNTLVIVANNGAMPTSVAAQRAVADPARLREIADRGAFMNTRATDGATRLAPLSDIIPVRLPGLRGNVYSVGDVLIVAGGSAFIYCAARPIRARRKPDRLPAEQRA